MTSEQICNRTPLVRAVPRGAARPYHVLARDSFDIDGRRWLRGTHVLPGPTLRPVGQPASQVLKIQGHDVRFLVEDVAEAMARMRARWAEQP